MSGLSDRTGTLTRVVGFGGLMMLVATALVLREPPPAEPEASAAPAQAAVVTQAPLPAPAVGKDRVRKLFPAYPGANITPMGMLEANGNPMEMSFFDTRSPAADVLDFYRREFRQRGYHVVTEPDGKGGGAVNYYDPMMGALISVTAVGVGSGREAHTMVFPSIVEAPQGVHLQGSAPEALPLPPGAVTVLRVDDRSPGPSDGSSTVTQVAHGTPQMLADFYKAEMAGRGFVQKDSHSSNGVEMLDFSRAGERVSLSLSPIEKEGLPQSLVTLVMERAPELKEPKQ
ncbi:hypothetical protein [Hyalangium gracile]|uniref:hypothetical protein n=1 Tax=Hyalangium gracile TaxID=394092 RepID=UPI001CC8F15A|nr:hypothetical protein [Hyalangium gracile]